MRRKEEGTDREADRLRWWGIVDKRGANYRQCAAELLRRLGDIEEIAPSPGPPRAAG